METLIYNGESNLQPDQGFTYGVFKFVIIERTQAGKYRYTLHNTETGKTRDYTNSLTGLRNLCGYVTGAQVIEEPAAVVEIIEEPAQQPAKVTPQAQSAPQVDVAQALTALQAVFGGGKDTELQAAVDALAARVATLEASPARKIEITQGGQVTHAITGVQHEKKEVL